MVDNLARRDAADTHSTGDPYDEELMGELAAGRREAFGTLHGRYPSLISRPADRSIDRATVGSGHPAGVPVAARAAARIESDRRSGLGVVPAPDGEPGSIESRGARYVVEMRARRLLEARIQFKGHPDFDDPTATAEIIGPMPEPAGRREGRGKARARDVLHSSDADLPDFLFLTREQEVHQFRKMNFLKYQAYRLRGAIDPSRARAADLDRVEKLLREAGAIRNRIIRSFLGLVVSIVKRCDGPSQDFSDLASEGNVALIRASERFDFGRGIRFSTYATQVIMNDFARRIPRDRSRCARFATGRAQRLQAVDEHRGRPDVMDPEQFRYMIRTMVSCLHGRERTIIVRRFGLACDKQTLVEIGRELGISKERVRQLESRALDKLRTIAEMRHRDPKDEWDLR